MSKKAVFLFAALAALAALAVSACGGGPKAPTTPDGKPLTLVVLVDRGLDGKTPDQQNQLNQLGDFQQTNLIAALKDAGYNASLINSAGEYQPSAGLYLLKVTVVKYNPGSKAARMMVGFGAGSTSLDLHYELYSTDPAAPFYSKDHGRASSVDWPKLVRTVDSEMITDITNQLAAQPK
jgi:hypothetical protein